MTRALATRDRHGWLTHRALVSGLREQYAHEMSGEKRTAQLRCTVKPELIYTVEYLVDDVVEQTHTFTELRLAQARYTALVHKARRPSLERNAS